VTVSQFARFVQDAGYTTVAERPLDRAEFPDAYPASTITPSRIERS